MKSLSCIFRIAIYLAAAWFFYVGVASYFSITSAIESRRIAMDTAVSGQADSLSADLVLQLVLPPIVIALLLVVPYERLNCFFRATLLSALLLVGAYSWFSTVGHYFFSGRFVPEAIPSGIWIHSACFVVVYLLFAARALCYKGKSRTERCS